MVTYKNSSRFWASKSGGKYQLDVPEIRSAFLAGQEWADSVRNFRAERIADVLSGNTPVPINAAPTLVLHLVPQSWRQLPPAMDLQQVRDSHVNLRPVGGYAYDTTYNLDGVVAFCSSTPMEVGAGYVQVFRDGRIEAVDVGVLASGRDNSRIDGRHIEARVIEALGRYSKVLVEGEVPFPTAVLVSLTDVTGYQVVTGRPAVSGQSAYDTLSGPRVRKRRGPDLHQ